MIKLVVFFTKVIIMLIIALLFSSCRYSMDLGNGIDGNGNVKKETRSISQTFTKVSANRGIDVTITQGDQVSVEVEADENLLKHITTTVENGTLVITSDENIDSAEMETVRVTLPTITGLEATSGADLNSTNTLKGSNIVIESTSGSEIELILEYEAVKSETTSGSSTKLSGKALKLQTSSTSGSHLDAGDLHANEVIAESSSGSSTEVHALLSLKAEANSGSSINYHGRPTNITKDESSGGSINAE